MHPYLTERMLYQSEALAPSGRSRWQLRERLDGSGYPRRLSGPAIPSPARVLGAADAYQAMCEPRPHRDALGSRTGGGGAARRGEGRAAWTATSSRRCSAPLAIASLAGVRARPASRPARWTFCGWCSRGLSSKEIAARLVISPKTARNHIEHIYSKIGVSNRAGAGLFAMQHGLLPDQELGWS